MFTIFRNSLSKSRGQILGWGLSLALLGAYLISFFDSFSGMEEQVQGIMESFPRELMAFFGDFGEIFTPQGYLSVEFFSYLPLILGIYAILVGSGLLASDEESGVLDLLLSQPISRTSFFLGRLLGFITATIAMLLIIWLSFAISLNWSNMDLSPIEMARPFLSLLGIVLLFGIAAILLSQLLPSRRLTAMIAGLLLVASFFITSLANIDPDLEQIARFSPLNYYQSGEAISGLNWEWLGGLFGFALLFALLAGWRFNRRDIRVGGEGTWGGSISFGTLTSRKASR